MISVKKATWEPIGPAVIFPTSVSQGPTSVAVRLTAFILGQASTDVR